MKKLLLGVRSSGVKWEESATQTTPPTKHTHVTSEILDVSALSGSESKFYNAN